MKGGLFFTQKEIRGVVFDQNIKEAGVFCVWPLAHFVPKRKREKIKGEGGL